MFSWVCERDSVMGECFDLFNVLYRYEDKCWFKVNILDIR